MRRAHRYESEAYTVRIGHGYDAHRIEYGRDMILGGIRIDSPFGLAAHSDGDVLIHALADAILGAAALRDIGYYFPDTSDITLGMDSAVILKHAVDLARSAGLELDYADITVIAQNPKLSPHIDAMRKRLADIMEISESRINVKATTEEKLGFTGRGEGISAHAVCLLSE